MRFVFWKIAHASACDVQCACVYDQKIYRNSQVKFYMYIEEFNIWKKEVM